MMPKNSDDEDRQYNILTDLALKLIKWLEISTEKARADLKFNDYIYGTIADMRSDTDYSDDFKEDQS
jgi:hypothetical protein